MASKDNEGCAATGHHDKYFMKAEENIGNIHEL